MKLQGLSVVFALIVLPLILVLTYYIHLQVDSIGLQNKYDSYLLNSTHDAMSSFEINTANEDLSSVSDSLRSIIEASSNIFFNTLSTKLGMSNASKSYVEPYVPAILYTLYDGYYIYSPTKVPTVLTDTDGNAISVGDIGVSGVESGGKMVYKYTNPEAPEGYLKYSDIPDTQKSEYGQLLYLKEEAADGSKIYTADIDEAKFNVKNVLKTYMPYSARYQTADGNKDITVIYTLDNYITIQGTVKKDGYESTYYTKSGYLLPRESSGKVSCVDINTASGVELLKYSGDILTSYYNQNDAEKYIKQGNEVTVTIGGDISITSGGATFVANTGVNTYDEAIEKLNSLKTRLNNAQTLKAQIDKGIIGAEDESVTNFLDKYSYSHIIGINTLKLEKAIKSITADINNIQYELDKMSACIYYVNAAIFSNWVYGNLDDIQASDLVEISGQSYKSINGTEEVISEMTGKIFDVKGSTTEGVIEIDEDSPFYTNKLNVIRNSIQYNLNSAMSTYNAASASTSDYSMPVLLNEEWEKILSNVSIVSFMQGYKCGLKTYNNYMIVSSTNNEIAVSPENIFYVEKDKFCDENTEYHRINCPDIPETEEYIAFTSKEVKYDKLYDKNNSSLPYTFDHRNLACYHCINDGNYKGSNIFDTADANYGTDLYKKLRKAYYLGIAKCRNNLYKMNSVSESQGYEVIYNKPDDPAYISNTINSTTVSSLTLGNIKTIELVLDTLKAKDPVETVVRYKVKIGDEYLNSEIYPIVTNVTSDYTLVINVDPSISSNLRITIDSLKFENQLVAEGGESSVYATDYTGAELYTDILDVNEKNTKIVLNAVKYARVIYR